MRTGSAGRRWAFPCCIPWANRLSRPTYVVAGTEAALPGDVPLFDRDHNGLPIHGALPGLLRWEVAAATAEEERACLRARLHWEPAHEAFRIFPFPHRLDYEAVLQAAIEITVTLVPTGNVSVPASFGFHPYLRIPGGSRADARVTLPVRGRLSTTAR